MFSKAIRIPVLLATFGSIGGTLAFGHGEHESALTSAPFPVAHLHFDWALAIGAGLLVLVWLGIWLASRFCGGPRSASRSHPGEVWASRIAGTVLVLLLWVLPWLSLHDTHHALENGTVSCPVAQIVHSQAGGILQSAPALVPQIVVFRIVLPISTAPSSRPSPQPAARSPPV